MYYKRVALRCDQVRKLQSDIPNLMKDYERQRRTSVPAVVAVAVVAAIVVLLVVVAVPVPVVLVLVFSLVFLLSCCSAHLFTTMAHSCSPYEESLL